MIYRTLTPDQREKFWRNVEELSKMLRIRNDRPVGYPEFIVEHRMMMALRVYHGGFWRTLWAEAWNHLSFHLHPRMLAGDLWFWLGDKTGRYVCRNWERHAWWCKRDLQQEMIDEPGDMEAYLKYGDDECLYEAMPQWLRRRLEP